jgi:superfamily II DNA or RNA helicase
LDKQDLRETSMERLRMYPPKYMSPTDIELILACGKVLESDWEATPTRSMSFHPLLARAYGTGRLMLPDGSPLQLDGDLWRLAPVLEVKEGAGRFSFSLESLDSSASGLGRSKGRAPRISLHGAWTIFGEEGNWTVRIGSDLFRLDPRTPKALFSLAENLPDLPLEALNQVRAELRDLSRGGVEIPAECLPPRLREAPKRCAVIELAGEDVTISAKVVYPSLEVPDDATEELLAFTAEDGSLVELERDLAAEAKIVEDLDEALHIEGVDKIACTGGWRIVAPASLRQMAVHTVPSLEKAGWDIRQAACLNRWKRRTGVLKMVGKDSGQDWFEVSGFVDFEGLQIPLSTLIARKGQLQLSDGSVGEISEALLKRLRWMEKLGTRTEDGIRLRKFQAVLAREIVENGHAEAHDLTAWNRQLACALDVDAVEVPVPTSLQATLRPYQKTGLDWLVSLRRRGIGGILADDMGLGKTIQVIAHLCHLFESDPNASPALVVGPATVVGNWISEFERFAPHLETRLLHGNDRDALRDAPITRPTVFVTTYGILPRETEWLRSQEFSLLVLDESQAIRNPATVTHQCCVQMGAKQKLCLTGTPIENSLSDLWAQFSFLNPGLLGPREEFLSEFTPEPDEKPDLTRLRMLTSPFWLRRTKREVAQDLPGRTDILLNVELEAKQMTLYQRQLKDYQKELLPQIKKKGLDSNGRFQVLTALLRLRQIACAPELAGHKGAAAKLDLLMEKIAEDLAEGHRILVFSTFTSLLDLVGQRLRKLSMDYLRFDGATPPAERTRLIKQFQTEQGESIFLISLKAGGAGVNLTAADTVFLLDPWWNPAAEEQAAARAHRIGQTRPVTLYRMVAKGTIEERVLALSRSKAELASDLFDAGVSGGALLTPAIVQELLG